MDPEMLKDKSKYVECDTHIQHGGQGYCGSYRAVNNKGYSTFVCAVACDILAAVWV
jgi:hypothetical protein